MRDLEASLREERERKGEQDQAKEQHRQVNYYKNTCWDCRIFLCTYKNNCPNALHCLNWLSCLSLFQMSYRVVYTILKNQPINFARYLKTKDTTLKPPAFVGLGRAQPPPPRKVEAGARAQAVRGRGRQGEDKGGGQEQVKFLISSLAVSRINFMVL